MSKSNQPKKKVVVTTSAAKPATPASSPRAKAAVVRQDPIFGKNTYRWMLIGVGLIFVGMILMSGGAMPSPEVWDDNIIYSFRRTVIAPVFILAGLGVEIYAIFKR
jgi:hypothetical protein